MIRIDTLLAGLFEEKQWHRRLELHAVFAKWPEIVGPEIAEMTAPEVIRGTVLWIGVADSVWIQQLHFEKQGILVAINRCLDAGGEGSIKVSDLRFHLDVSLGREKPVLPPPKARPAPRPIDQEKLAAFQGMAATIADPEIRERLLGLWRKAQQYPS